VSEISTPQTSPDAFTNLQLFGGFQAGILILILVLFFRFFTSRSRDSHFKSEPFQSNPSPRKMSEPLGFQATPQKSSKKPLQIEGFSFTGEPHEILGIRRNANESEIRKAHRVLMKRFHPDKMGQQGSKQWQESQKIAEKINSARDRMLSSLRSR